MREAATYGLLPAKHGLGLGKVRDETAGGMGSFEHLFCFGRHEIAQERENGRCSPRE